MNRIENALSEICNRHRLQEKILIVPSFSAGHQITESMVRNGGAYLNLRIKTLPSLAHEFAALDLAKSSVTYVSDSSLFMIIENLFPEVIKPGSYFSGLESREGMIAAAAECLRELRLCGIGSGDLSPDSFVERRKGEEIKTFLARYEAFLKAEKFVDYPQILLMAIQALKERYPGLSSEQIFLIPSDVPFAPIEKAFLDLLPGDKMVLPHNEVIGFSRPGRYLDPTVVEKSTAAKTDIARLAWLFSPAEASPPFGDGTVRIYHAVGRRNEVKEVFRRLLGDGAKADETEIIYTSYDDFTPLIIDLASKAGIALTFEEGLPVTLTQPGKASLGLLSWFSSGFEAVKFRKLLSGGNLAISPDNDQITLWRMAQVVRESTIYTGKERYVPVLEKISAAARQVPPAEEGSPDCPTEKDRIDALNAAFLIEMVKEIFGAIPAEDEKGTVSLAELSGGISKILAKYTRVSDQLDGGAKKAIGEVLDEACRFSKKRLPFREALERIETIIRQAKVGRSGAAPGHLHVSSYRTGGRAGRRYTFIVGCEAGLFPGISLQNPLLLDDEKKQITGSLITSAERLREVIYRMASLLASLEGTVTLSFSSFDVLENRDSFPSSIVLQAYRLISGNPAAHYTELQEALGAPSGYVPSGNPLDSSDLWIKMFTGKEGIKKTDRSVFSCYPGLVQGLKAREARDSDSVTEYDGRILVPEACIDPREKEGPVMSASMIEEAATCPFSYLLKYVLMVRPPDEAVISRDAWLDAAQRGTLLHEIFCTFMSEIGKIGEKPSVKKHEGLITTIAEDLMKRYREEVPPPSNAVFEQERKAVLKTTMIFLKVEEKHCKKCTPLYFELPFGMSTGGWGEDKYKEPVKISLEEGKSFRLRGKIDRIDSVDGAENDFEIWDYKTGSARNFKEPSCLNHGKTIQHGLYALAAEQILRTSGKGENASVKRSGYVFPTEKGRAKRIIPSRDDYALAKLLKTVFDFVREGIFVPTDDEKACRYCDYVSICGEFGGSNMAGKMDKEGNKELDAIKVLREHE